MTRSEEIKQALTGPATPAFLIGLMAETQRELKEGHAFRDLPVLQQLRKACGEVYFDQELAAARGKKLDGRRLRRL